MTDLDVKTYIDFFDRTWFDLMGKQDQFPLEEYGERSMLTTWKISYDQVLRRSEAAAWLLRLWAFFHHDDLWYGLLAKSGDIEEFVTFETPTWLAELSESELEFSSAMGLLKAYSLAESTGAGSYTMHSVLHRWSRSLSLDADAALLVSISICVLAKASPSTAYGLSWKLERRLLQHVLHVCNELRMTRILAQHDLPSGATNLLGHLLRHQEKRDDAAQMYQRALLGYEKALGPNHTSTLETVNNLGLSYWRQGKLGRAKKMFQRALIVQEKELGPNHMSTLDTVNNLGITYAARGKLGRAKKMFQRALILYEKELGSNHISTFDTVNNLGIIYWKQGKLDKGEQMFQRALSGHEKINGTEASSALSVSIVSNLGCLYYEQGRLDETEKMFRRALTGLEEMYGKEALSISLLESVENLGLLHHDQGRPEEAERMIERALAGYLQIYGPSHRTTSRASKELEFLRCERGELLHLYLLSLS